MGATAHPTRTIPCWLKPWHGGNNPNIYSSAFCQGQQFLKLLIRFISRLTSASQIWATIIFIASYCESEVALVSMPPQVAARTRGGHSRVGRGCWGVLPLLSELNLWHISGGIASGTCQPSRASSTLCRWVGMGGSSHPTEKGFWRISQSQFASHS